MLGTAGLLILLRTLLPPHPHPQVNPDEERLARWTTCQLSGMALQPPCVADELGSLFNKDAVLQVKAAPLSSCLPTLALAAGVHGCIAISRLAASLKAWGHASCRFCTPGTSGLARLTHALHRRLVRPRRRC